VTADSKLTPLTAGCTRRSILAGAAVTVLPAFEDPWAEATRILERIRPPVFPNRDFPAGKFGAAGDGVKDDTAALRKAIAACARAGGGRVLVPGGVFRTGALHLESGVNLVVAEGATLRFDPEPGRYLPVVFTRWEGLECLNYSPLVYAFGKRNVAVTGGGTLDGGADNAHWWPWKGRAEYGWKKGEPSQQKARDALGAAAESGVALERRVFGEGSLLRPNFVQFYRCQNVLVEGVTIVNSPMWEIHPVLSANVCVRGVKVSTHGPNNDGCNPECCRDVLIEDCRFDTGDDCIAIKSGRNADGRRVGVPSENIVVRKCVMKDGHGGVTIGSEVSGGCRNVFVEDCRMDSPNLDRMLRLKTNSYRGGFIEGVYCRNIQVGQVSGAVVEVDFLYEEGAGGPHLPRVSGIELRGITCSKSGRVLNLRGYPEAPIRNVIIEDCIFGSAAAPDVIEHVEGLRMARVTRS
jgi:polygalacturonase